MPLTIIWRRLTGRSRRRVSFYESQQVMREAALKPGRVVDMSHFTAQELERIVLNERMSPRGKAALEELEARVARNSH
ncbi:MAG: hypothetical protein GC184_10325 [Rhizobiales bacterium]|nr:hypothetical protein [Hyphomicrobiales bacterium]